jgi:FkbM family methyltransferase
MAMNLKRTAWRLIPASIKPKWRPCHSQEGEDIVLTTFFDDQEPGIYVDIGAHDPVAWSNTKKLADRGWRGLNIDPMPGAAERFRKHRPRDIFLQAAVDIGSNVPLYYWMFDMEPRWNCLAPTEPIPERHGKGFHPTSHVAIQVIPIEEALSRTRLPRVDLLNIDIEGGENYILSHWPWDRYTPKAVCVEIIGTPAAETAHSGLTRFLERKGLVFTSQLVCSAIYMERNFLASRYPQDSTRSHFRRPCLGQAALN